MASSKSQLHLWFLVVSMGASGVGLLVFGLTRPNGPQNLADPMPVAQLVRSRPRTFDSEPSPARIVADAQNAEKRKDCEMRREDCNLACMQYPKKSDSANKCKQFCDRAEASCLDWAHR